MCVFYVFYERFLSAVNPQVFGEVYFTREALSTLTACVGFLSGLNPDVLIKVSFDRESLAL